jgi:hypothetical protein
VLAEIASIGGNRATCGTNIAGNLHKILIGGAGVRLRLTRQKPERAVRGQKALRLLWDTAFLTAGDYRYKPVRTGC